jgi:hypothetical protein
LEAINQIRMKVLTDGTVSINTDAFEEEVHAQADELVNTTMKALGGEVKIIERKNPDHHHHHTHGNGVSHSH